MPEEFRIWKEKIDLIEAKKKVSVVETSNSSSLKKNDSKIYSNGSLQTAQQQIVIGSKEKEIRSDEPVATVFSSSSEALEAFNNLLLQHKVSVAAKLKDVHEQFMNDPCYLGVLKLVTPGDRKQALAEYQV